MLSPSLAKAFKESDEFSSTLALSRCSESFVVWRWRVVEVPVRNRQTGDPGIEESDLSLLLMVFLDLGQA